tara:strand:- start:192 stop:716 length:525 start_codon:yes stop_codon:yes gene_type:complete
MQKHFKLSLLTFLFFLVSAREPLADQLEYLKKIGDAKLKVLFWDIYNASLYSKTKEYKEEQFPQALQIIYLRNIDSEDLIEKTEEEWEKLGINQVKFNKWITLLKNIYPDIKKGDKLLFIVYENLRSEFFLNDKTIGKISDINFGKSFLRIWLDKDCSFPELRNKLIGLNSKLL